MKPRPGPAINPGLDEVFFKGDGPQFRSSLRHVVHGVAIAPQPSLFEAAPNRCSVDKGADASMLVGIAPAPQSFRPCARYQRSAPGWSGTSIGVLSLSRPILHSAAAGSFLPGNLRFARRDGAADVVGNLLRK